MKKVLYIGLLMVWSSASFAADHTVENTCVLQVLKDATDIGPPAKRYKVSKELKELFREKGYSITRSRRKSTHSFSFKSIPLRKSGSILFIHRDSGMYYGDEWELNSSETHSDENLLRAMIQKIPTCFELTSMQTTPLADQ